MSEQLLGAFDRPVGTEKYKQYKFSTGHSVHLTDGEVGELFEQAKQRTKQFTLLINEGDWCVCGDYLVIQGKMLQFLESHFKMRAND